MAFCTRYFQHPELFPGTFNKHRKANWLILASWVPSSAFQKQWYKKRWWDLLSNSVYFAIRCLVWNVLCRYKSFFLKLQQLKHFILTYSIFSLLIFSYCGFEFFTYIKEIRPIITCPNMFKWIQMWREEMVGLWGTHLPWITPYYIFFFNLSLCFL